MLYLAYGSNMACSRIQARLGPCRLVGVGRLDGYALRFHKRGKDGSGKCDAFFTGLDADRLFGVVFELTPEQSTRLDDFEGPAYERRALEVASGTARIETYAYVARPSAIDPGLVPYLWYHAYVVHGATAAGLPADYVARLQAVPGVPDPDRERARSNALILEVQGSRGLPPGSAPMRSG